MRRSTILLLNATILAAIGIALLGVARAVTPRPPGAPRPSHSLSIATAYIEATNQVLATGDQTAFERLVSADLLDHGSEPEAGRAPLLRWLMSVRTTYRDTAITIQSLTVERSMVTARLAWTSSTSPREPAFSLPAPPLAWETIEIIAIRDGVIVERWGRPPSSIAARLAEPLLAHPGETASAVLARLSTPAHAPIATIRLPGPALIVVESGRIAVDGGNDTRSASPAHLTSVPIPAGASATLEPGDAALLPKGGSTVRLNGGAGLLVALLLPARPTNHRSQNATPEPSDPLSLIWSSRGGEIDGVLVHPLGTLPVSAAESSRLAVTASRIFLQPGVTVTIPSGDASLVAVERGCLSVAPRADRMQAATSAAEFSGARRVPAGSSAEAQGIVATGCDSSTVTVAVVIEFAAIPHQADERSEPSPLEDGPR